MSLGTTTLNRGARILIALFAMLMLEPAAAQSGPRLLNISGGLFHPNGNPVLSNNVTFKIEVRDKAGLCVLYSETHSSQDLSSTKGGFSLLLGGGSSPANKLSGTTALDAAVFKNPGAVAAFTDCPSGLTLNAGDERVVRVYYDIGQGLTAMNPDVPIVAAAYSMVAETLQGKTPDDFINVQGTASSNLQQTNLEYAFSLTNWQRLKDLIDGSSSQYLPTAGTGAFNFGNRVLTGVAAPGTTADAVNKGYADSYIGGKATDLTSVGAGFGNGQTIVWDQVQNKWVTGAPTDSTKLPLAGGTMAGNINMGGYDLLNVGNIVQGLQKTHTLGRFTSVEEATLVATLGTANAGMSWYNTDLKTYKIWDGSNALTQAYLSSVGTSPGTLNSAWFPATGVSAGTYGGATSVPVFTVGADGRLTVAYGTTISGVAPGGAAGGDLTGSYPSPLIAPLAVTTAKLSDNAITAAKIKSSGVAINRLIATDPVTPNTLTYFECPINDQIMTWTPNGWDCTTVAALSPVKTVAGRTPDALGNVPLTAYDISGIESAATKDYGTAAGELVELDGAGKIPSSLLPVGTGTITSVSAVSPLVGGGVSGAVTVSIDVGTGANQVVQLNGSAQIPAVDGSLLTGVNASKIGTRTVTSAAPGVAQVLAWNGSQWEPTTAAVGSMTGVVSGAGLVAGTVTSYGTIAVDLGTAANQVVQLNGSAQIPAVDGSLLTGVNASKIGTRAVTSAAPGVAQVLAWNGLQWEPTTAAVGSVTGVVSGAGMVAGTVSSYGTIAVDVGTAANKVVQFDGSARYPANDGSLITNVNAVRLQSYFVSAAAPSANQILKWNGSQWEPTTDLGTGTVTSVVSGTGLVAGTITVGGTIAVDIGTGANQVVQLNGSSQIPAVDGSLLTGVNASKIGTRAVTSAAPGVAQVLAWNGSQWEPTSAAVGSVVNVTSGTGLVAGTITSAGTINIDVGSTSNKIVQLDNSGLFPAIDSSMLFNVNASKIGTRTVTSAAPGVAQVLAWNGSQWEPTSAAVGSVTGVVSGTGLVAGTISSYGSINVDLGTAANKVVQFDGSARYPANDGSLITNVNAVRLQSQLVSATAPTTNQILKWNGSQWEASTDTGTGTVVSVVSGTGLVAGTITVGGTVAVDVGTGANQVVQLNGSSQIPAVDGSLLTGVNASKIGTRIITSAAPGVSQVLGWNGSQWEPMSAAVGSMTSVTAGAGLVPGTITSAGTIAVDVGTGANKVVQFDGSARYPANDGSLITNVNAVRLQSQLVSATAPTANQILKWNGSQWEPTTDTGTGTVTSVVSGAGLVAGTITNNGTVAVDVGTGANQVVQLNGSSQIPAVDGSLLTGVNASKIGTRAVTSSAPSTNQVLAWNGSQWEPTTAATGSVTSVISGSGLVAGTITGAGTVSVDVGTAANKVVQFDGSARYPANDGSLITNVNAVRLQSQLVSATAPTANQILKWNGSQWEPTTDTGTGTVTSVVSGTGLVTGTITNGGTIAVDVGTGANQVVQLNAFSQIPAVDGSLLTGVNASKIGTRAVTSAAPSTNQVLAWNGSQWEPTTAATGSVTNVTAGTGLVAGTITSTGTLNIDVGTGANKIVQLNGSAQIPAVDGSLLTNVNASTIGTRAIATILPTTNQILTWNGSRWEPMAASSSLSWPLTATPGTAPATAPSYSFAGDTDTGFFSTGAGTAAFATNGTARMTIDSTGQVGIGTASPNAAFDVAGEARAWVWGAGQGSTSNPSFMLSGGGYGMSFPSGNTVAFISNSMERMRIDTNGNVGIGTSAPGSVALDVVGTGANNSAILVPRLTTALRPAGANGMVRYNTNTNKFEFFENNAWVNYGTGSGSVSFPLLASPGTTPSTAPSYAFASDSDTGFFSTGAGTAAFATNGTARMTVTSTGNVGIGTTTPSDVLHVRSTNSTGPAVTISTPGTVNGQQAMLNLVSKENGSAALGNTGTEGWQLWVNGDATSGYYGPEAFGLSYYNGSTWRTPFYSLPENYNATLFGDNLAPAAISGGDNRALFGQNLLYDAQWGNYVTINAGTGYSAIESLSGTLTFYTSNAPTVNMSNSGSPPARMVIANSGNIGIGTITPGSAALDVVGTGANNSALIVPRLTTALRPAGANGMLRYNTNTNKFEFFENGNWVNYGTGASGSVSFPLLASPGTTPSTAPSYAFASDSDTGFFSPGVGTASLATNGTARMTVDSTGYVGIGTTAPVQALHVEKSVDAAVNIKLRNSNAGNAAEANLIIANDTNDMGYLWTASSTNTNDTTARDRLMLVSSSFSNGLSLRADGAFGDVRFFTGTTAAERMRITNAGLVGIGTSSPGSAALDVVGTGANNSALIVPRLTTALRPAGANGMIRYNTNTNKFEFFENNAWVNYGTGSGSASFPLLASPGTTPSTAPSYAFASDSDTGFFSTGAGTAAFATNGTARMTIDSRGYVGIGTTAPAGPIDVRGGSMTGANGKSLYFYAQDAASNSYDAGDIYLVPGAATGVGGGRNGVVNIGVTATPTLPSSVNIVSKDYTDWTDTRTYSLALADQENSSFRIALGYDFSVSAGIIQSVYVGSNFTNTAINPNGGNVAIGSVTPGSAALNVDGTTNLNSAIVIPRATTAARPGTAVNGMIRYNTNTNKFEFFENNAWVNYGTGSGGSVSFPLLASPGTTPSTAPSYAFASDSDTGFFSPGAGTASFATNGTTRMTIDSAGNIGVGTSSSGTYKLNVNGDVMALSYYGVGQGFEVGRAGSSVLNFWDGYVSFSHAIGGNLTGAGWMNNAVGSAASPTYGFSSWGGGMYAPSSNVLRFATSSTDRMSITAAGNIGIGTTSPGSVALDVVGTGANNSALLVPRLTTALRPAGANGMIRYNTNANKFEFFENGSWVNYGTGSGGSVSFPLLASPGTTPSTAPSYAFASDSDTGFFSPGAGTASLATNGTARMTVDSAGNVGIGTTNPVDLLHIRSASSAGPSVTISTPGTVFGQQAMLNLITKENGTATLGGTGVKGWQFWANGDATTPGNILALTFADGPTWSDQVRFYPDGGTNLFGSVEGPALSGRTNRALFGQNLAYDSQYGIYHSTYATATGFSGVEATSGQISFYTSNAATANWTNVGTPTSRMLISSGGNIGIGTSTPGSAALDVVGTGANNSAILVPRLTTALRPAGANGMIRYNTNTNKFEFFENSAWVNYGTGSGSSSFPLLASPGTTPSTAPSYSFASDSDTGFFSTGAGTAAFATNGTARMTLDSAGLVGIGTASPTEALQVVRAGAAFVEVRATTSNGAGFNAVSNSGNNTYNGFYSGGAASGSRQKYIGNMGGYLAFGKSDDAWSTNVDQMVILTSGNVGIGTSSPTQQFHLYSSNPSSDVMALIQNASNTAGSGAILTLQTTHTDADPYIRFQGNFTESFYAGVDADDSGKFKIGSTGASPKPGVKDALTITSGGALGIGTSSPGSVALEIVGTGANNSALLIPRNTTALRPAGTNGMLRYNTNINKFEFFENGTWTIHSSSGSFPLLASPGTTPSTAPSYAFNSDSDTGFFSPGVGTAAFATNGTARMTIDSLGNVGIGTAIPAGVLEVYKPTGNSDVLVVHGSSGTSQSIAANISNWPTASQTNARVKFVDDGNYSAHIAFETNRASAATTTTTELMRLSSAGYLGIGTPSPNALLHINTTATGDNSPYQSMAPSLTSGSTIYNLIGRSAASNDSGFIGYTHNTTQASRSIGIGHYGQAPAVNVSNSGNVGVGTTAPDTTLDVNGQTTLRNAYYETYGSLGTLGCGATNITGYSVNMYTLTACSSGTTTLNIPTVTGWPSGNKAWTLTVFVTGQTSSVFNITYNSATTNVFWDKNSTGGTGGSGFAGYSVASGKTYVFVCTVLNTGIAYCGVGAQY